MSETRIHPETGKVLTRGVRRQVLQVGQLIEEIDVPGWYSEDGLDSLHSGSDLAGFDGAYRILRQSDRDPSGPITGVAGVRGAWASGGPGRAASSPSE